MKELRCVHLLRSRWGNREWSQTGEMGPVHFTWILAWTLGRRTLGVFGWGAVNPRYGTAFRALQVALVWRTRLPMQEMQEIQVQSLDQEDPLEEDIAAHSSILAWRVLWTEEPCRLQSTGSQRVSHDWSRSVPTQSESGERNDTRLAGWGLWVKAGDRVRGFSHCSPNVCVGLKSSFIKEKENYEHRSL